jgi:hypothetical protein
MTPAWDQWQWRLAINFMSQMPDAPEDIRLVMRYMRALMECAAPVQDESGNVVPLAPVRR